MGLLVNIDVPDLERAIAFYTEAFGLTLRRRFADQGAELAGWPAAVFLLKKDAGTIGAAGQPRTYERHWTPVHLDVVVEEIGAAVDRAVAAGAVVEHPAETAKWEKVVNASGAKVE